MNTSTGFNQRQRFEKNKNKARRHEPRVETAAVILHGVNVINKKERMAIKNFKRNQYIERNPMIDLLRCKPTNQSDIDDWNDWLNEQ